MCSTCEEVEGKSVNQALTLINARMRDNWTDCLDRALGKVLDMALVESESNEENE